MEKLLNDLNNIGIGFSKLHIKDMEKIPKALLRKKLLLLSKLIRTFLCVCVCARARVCVRACVRV
jgi:hypothetical protein